MISYFVYDLLAISVGSGELLLLPEVGFALRGSEAGASRGPFPAAPVPPQHHRGLGRKGALGKHGETHGETDGFDCWAMAILIAIAYRSL